MPFLTPNQQRQTSAELLVNNYVIVAKNSSWRCSVGPLPVRPQCAWRAVPPPVPTPLRYEASPRRIKADVPIIRAPVRVRSINDDLSSSTSSSSYLSRPTTVVVVIYLFLLIIIIVRFVCDYLMCYIVVGALLTIEWLSNDLICRSGYFAALST